MTRGQLESPNLDDRTWQDIVDQARALIPTYAPNWTDHNPSDPGIALIELFAWMVEGLTYRLNRVPEKNLIEFLNLIGITRDPATPASTYIQYRLADRSPPLTVPAGHLLATPQTEENDALVFETDEPLRVLPTNLRSALYLSDGSAYQDVSRQLVRAPLDGQLLRLEAKGTGLLALGFDRATEEALALSIRLSVPAPAQGLAVSWHHSRADTPPISADGQDWSGLPVAVAVDGTDGLRSNGAMTLQVPGPWDSQTPSDWDVPAAAPTEVVDEDLFWLGLLLRNTTDQPLELGLEHILFNAVRATNALTMTEPESLGQSDGTPFQTFELAHAPLYKAFNQVNPYQHLRLEVREQLVGGGFGPWRTWSQVDSFPAGAGEAYRLHPVTGEIRFGNHAPATSVDGHGSIPPAGSEIRAHRYRYVAGDARGNLPPDTINVIRTPLPGLVAVTNPGAASGGSNEESIEETKRRAPAVLRNRDRAVTVEDYEYLAREATTDVYRARCLPERLFGPFEALSAGAAVGDPWTFGGLNRDKGHINVIVIPNAPAVQDAPLPSPELLQEVSAYLDARRVLGTSLHVTVPRYLPVDVNVEIAIWNHALQTGLVASPQEVVDELRRKIAGFLHPIYGGTVGEGWDVGQDFLVSGLLEFIQPPTHIGFISSLTVKAGLPRYQPPDRPRLGESDVWVQVADYELVCSGVATVQETIRT